MTPELLKQALEALQNVAQELHHIDAGPVKELDAIIAEVESASAAIDAHAALSPAPVPVVEALVALVSDSIEEVEDWAEYCPEVFKMKHKYDERVNDLRARLAALTGQGKGGRI